MWSFKMTEVHFSLPEEVVTALNHLVPTNQRDLFVANLLRDALARQEQELYDCALAVEQDEALNEEMADWDVTVADGFSVVTRKAP
jgi:hypothetical protein